MVSQNYQLDERVNTVRNIQKSCFNCGVSIYINPKVRKANDMNKLAILDTEYKSQPNEEPNLHTCKPKGEVKNPYQTTTDVSSNLYPDQSPQATEKRELIQNTQKKESAFSDDSVTLGNRKFPFPTNNDFERLEKKVDYLKDLIEATLRVLDKKQENEGKEGVLFTKASNLQDTKEKNIPRKDADFIDEPVTPRQISSREEVIKNDDGFLEEEDEEVIIER